MYVLTTIAALLLKETGQRHNMYLLHCSNVWISDLPIVLDFACRYLDSNHNLPLTNTMPDLAQTGTKESYKIGKKGRGT
jgi:hypothetical protein